MKFEKKIPFIVAILVIAGILLSRFMFTGSKKGIPKELFYVKDTGLYSTSLKSLNKTPVKYADNFVDKENISKFFNYHLNDTFVSKDGKYHFMVADRGEDGDLEEGYSLYYSKGNGKLKEIDNGLQGLYTVTDDNKVIYTKNEELYVSNLKENRNLVVPGFGQSGWHV